MYTITIKINNEKALKLLENLEALNLIKVIEKSETPDKEKKLSESLAGSISNSDYEKLLNELNQMRGEWERDI